MELLSLSRKTWLIIYFPLGILVIIMVIFFKCSDATDYFARHTLHEDYRAIITKKYIDGKNRAARTFDLQPSDMLVTFGANDWKGLWDVGCVGDSVYKHAGDSHLYLHCYRDDSVYILQYNFDQPGLILDKR